MKKFWITYAIILAGMATMIIGTNADLLIRLGFPTIDGKFPMDAIYTAPLHTQVIFCAGTIWFCFFIVFTVLLMFYGLTKITDPTALGGKG